MLSSICRAILDKLNTAGISVRHTELRGLVDRTVNLSRPAVNIAINSAAFEQVTVNHVYKVTPEISLILLLQHLKGEERARLESQDILDSMMQALLLQDFGLELQDPMMPVSFRNITDQTYAESGFEMYEMIWRCSYNIEKTSDEEDWGILTSMLAKYYLQPRTETGMQGITGPEACDLIWYAGGTTGVDDCPCA